MISSFNCTKQSGKAMPILAAPTSGLQRIPMYRTGNHRQSPKKSLSMAMKDRPATSSAIGNNEAPTVPQIKISPAPSDLRFDRLQPSDEECGCMHRRAFGSFVAREALLDEEYWTAAWLRAESHWEDRSNARHVDSYRRQFAEQEFVALKRRCNRQHAEKCTCIVAVKKEEKNVKRTVLSSIVGSLDVSIRHLISGEAFPRERVTAPPFSSIYRTDQPRYGYVANLCVSKYARRQGIASNMLLLAVEAAKSHGAHQIFVHVRKDNMAARKLYDKIGFQAVKMALPSSLEEQKCLLCIET